MNKELLERISKSNEEYKRIGSLLKPLGFTLCTGAVFYGERPFSMYCGKMEDYRSFIDNIDSIRERSGNGKTRAWEFMKQQVKSNIRRIEAIPYCIRKRKTYDTQHR